MLDSIREPAVAGQFYPYNKFELKTLIKDLINKTPSATLDFKRIKALIVPHAGYVYSGYTAVSAYKYLQNQAFDEVFLLGPSHYYPADKIILANYKYWRTPFGLIKTSPRIKHIAEKNELFVINSIVHGNEHSLEVQLPFLQTFLKNNDFNIIPMLTNKISAYNTAYKLSELIDDNDLLVVSSDLSHYYSDTIARKIDNESIDFIKNLDSAVVDNPEFEACGNTGIAILLELIKIKGWNIKLVDYHNSGDFTNDKSRVVGYSSFIIYE